MADAPDDKVKASAEPEQQVHELAPEHDPAIAAEGASQTSTPHPPSPPKGEKSLSWTTWAWLIGIVSLLAAELYIYGHDGWIRVCIGKEGATDFALLDKPRSHQGPARAFPICVERLNLGMYSDSDDTAREALEQACARGATLMGGDQRECIRKDKGWARRVDKEHIPPWDKRLYRRLLFLD